MRGLVWEHVEILENVINAQIFAKVVVMEVAMVRVNPLQKEKIQLDLSGNLKIELSNEKNCRTSNSGGKK